MDKGIILGVIQVRMGSTRLPLKALLPVMDKPLLWYLYERISSSRLIERIVIATSDAKENLPIVKFAEENNIDYFAGSEKDLLDRHYKTMEKFKAGIMVRVTGDCPLIDPEVVDKVIKRYIDNQADYDYVSNAVRPTYPDGLDVDVLPFSTIKKMRDEVKDQFWREWFNSYIVEHPEEFRIANVMHEKDLSALRWTIDYSEDYSFMKEIFSRLYPGKKIFLMEDILKLMEKEPWLYEINKKYARNEAYYKAKETHHEQSGLHE